MTQYYVVYDSTGVIQTRYISGKHDTYIANPPNGWLLLEVPNWATASQTCNTGWTVANGALVPPPAPTLAQQLAAAQADQLALLSSALQSAYSQPVTYTSKGGVTQTYQMDPVSRRNLSDEMHTYVTAGTPTPAGYYWVAADNTHVPFVAADLQGLTAAIGAQGWTAFNHYQILKAQIASIVSANGTVAQIQAVVW